MTNTIFHEFFQLWAHWNQLAHTDDVRFEEERILFGPHSRQYMLRLGPQESVYDKVVLFYHGGGWQFGRPEMFRKYAHVLVREGYQVFMPSHRKIPFSNYTDMREDIQLALRAVGEWMEKRGGLERRVAIGGMSSGGNLAALLALDPENRRAAGFELERIAGLFLLAAPLNLDEMWASPSLVSFSGLRNGEMYRQANPIHFIDQTPAPPTLIVHGERDALVELASAQTFYEKMEAKYPGRAEWLLLPGGSHLDVASWAYQDNFIRYAMLHWLRGI